MAQPSHFRIQYLGSVEVEANKQYTASDFATSFPTANTFILKSKSTSNVPIKVSINATPAFEIKYDETTAFDGTSSLTYVFNQKCLIAICSNLDVA
jgi:hypothetical protein